MKQVIIGERALRIGVWTVIGLMIVAMGLGISKRLVDTAPEAPKSPPVKIIPAVEVTEVVVGSEAVSLNTQGEVAALRRTQVAAEVGGKVIAVSPKFEAGGVFQEGELMVRIEPADYKAAYANAVSTLESAKLSLEVEIANGERARRDWEKLGRGQASDLVLRKPQLASAKAAAASAEAAVEKALRDLERTEIRALYPCRLEQTYVDLGATVASGSRVVDVMSLGPVEVRLPLSLEDYGYVQRGEDGKVAGEVIATASLGGEQQTWTGQLIRSDGFVESTTRSVSVVALFGEDGKSAPPVGMFVDATLAGRSLENVIVLPRLALAEPGKVLVVTGDSRLEFREVDVVRTSEKEVVIRSGLEVGERVCVTTINAPVNGMEVLVAEGAQAEKGGG